MPPPPKSVEGQHLQADLKLLEQGPEIRPLRGPERSEGGIPTMPTESSVRSPSTTPPAPMSEGCSTPYYALISSVPTDRATYRAENAVEGVNSRCLHLYI